MTQRQEIRIASLILILTDMLLFATIVIQVLKRGMAGGAMFTG